MYDLRTRICTASLLGDWVASALGPPISGLERQKGYIIRGSGSANLNGPTCSRFARPTHHDSEVSRGEPRNWTVYHLITWSSHAKRAARWPILRRVIR